MKRECSEKLTEEFQKLKEKIGLFSKLKGEEDEIFDLEGDIPRFVEKSKKCIDIFIKQSSCEKPKEMFQLAHATLNKILEFLDSSPFLLSFVFILDETNFRSHVLTKYVIKGILPLYKQEDVSGIYFARTIRKFVTECGQRIQELLELYGDYGVKKIEELRERDKWICPLLDQFKEISKVYP